MWDSISQLLIPINLHSLEESRQNRVLDHCCPCVPFVLHLERVELPSFIDKSQVEVVVIYFTFIRVIFFDFRFFVEAFQVICKV